jgi:hypothetical protein
MDDRGCTSIGNESEVFENLTQRALRAQSSLRRETKSRSLPTASKMRWPPVGMTVSDMSASRQAKAVCMQAFGGSGGVLVDSVGGIVCLEC